MLLDATVVGLLPRITILILIAVDPTLPMLAHRNKLLVGIALTGRRHVLLQKLTLQRLVIVVNLSDCVVVVLAAGSDSVSRLLASNLIDSRWLPVVNL